MKRPVVTAFFSMAGGCLFRLEAGRECQSADFAGLYIFGVFVLVIVFWTYRIREKKYFSGILCVLFFIFGLLIAEGGLSLQRRYAFTEGKKVTLLGTLESIEEKSSNMQLIISLKDGARVRVILSDATVFFDTGGEKINLLDAHGEFSKRLGGTILVTGSKEAFLRASNPGNFDEEQYNYSLGIVLKLQAQELRIKGEGINEFKVFAAAFKDRLTDILYDICPDKEAGIFMALLYGEKGDLDRELADSFKDGGISHILAISGLHISIAGMGLFGLLRRGLPVKWAGLISSLFMAFYGIVTAGSISAQRAVIMFFIALAARLLGNIYDMKNAMAIAGIILLCQNPLYISNVSFLLSFGAVLAIAYILPCIKEFVSVKCRAVNSFLASMTINIVNAPVIANSYFEFASYGVFLNIIVIPLMSIVVICGFSGLIFGAFMPQAGKIIIYPGVLVIRLYELMCRFAARLPYNRAVTGHFEPEETAAYYFLIAIMSYCFYKAALKRRVHRETKEKKGGELKGKLIRLFAALLCMSGFYAAIFITFPERETVSFLDVGQGECGVFVSGEGMVCLFDAGSVSVKEAGKHRILPYLKYCGISSIDYLFLSHSDSDHISGVEEIFKDGAVRIKNIVLSPYDKGFEAIKAMARENGAYIIYGTEGMLLRDKSCEIKVISPIKEYIGQYADTNDLSMVVKIEINKKTILFTGDIGSGGEKLLAKKEGAFHVDILKAAHHGSKYSSCEELLSLLNPGLSIISCGKDNSYGHPHKEALDRLLKYSEEVHIISEGGFIRVKLSGGQVCEVVK